MAERINRSDDEKLYQPAIHSRRVRELHHLKLVTEKPMTVLLDEAIREYFSWVTTDERLTWEEEEELRDVLNHADREGNIRPAHHPDYSKPLEVWWLCKQHHRMADKGELKLYVS